MRNLSSDGPPLRVAFATLGCRLNQYETEGLKASLTEAAGCEVVPWDAAADVYVLNSCTVTAQADRKCRQLARQVKRRRPGSRVVVAGCYAQTQGQRLLALPEIDGIVGNTEKHAIEAWLRALMAGDEKLAAVQHFPRRLPFQTTPIGRFGDRSRAFLKVQDGCDLRCAYCLIWRARGPSRSRPLAEVVAEAAALWATGYREVVLVGVNLGSYGRDIDLGGGLAELAATLLTELPALRLRLSSLHPEQITPPLLELFAAHAPRLRPHLHLSLQSGSDSVLARMRRPYRMADVRRAAEATLAAVPGVNLGADIIVGYPGETDTEFAATRGLLDELPVSYLHVFPFSPRPGTAAASLAERPAPERVTARARLLRAWSQQRRRAFADRQRGARCEAIVENSLPEPGWRQATTDHYVGIVVPDHFPAGALIQVTLGRWRGGRLQGDDAEQIPAGPALRADAGRIGPAREEGAR